MPKPFADISWKYKKLAIFDILMTLAQGHWNIKTLKHMTTRQINPLFFFFKKSTFWAISISTFHFCISRPSKFSFLGSLHCIMFRSVKYTFTCQWWLSMLLTYISFFYIKHANLWYITCFVPHSITIWPQSHGLQYQGCLT